MKVSLKYKFIFLIAMVEVVFLSLLLLFSMHVIEKQERDLFKNKQEIVSKFINDIFATPILVNDIATLDDSLKNIVSVDDIIFVEILNSEKDKISSYCIANCQDFIVNKDIEGEYFVGDSSFFIQKQKIVLENEIIGYITIVFNITKGKNNIDSFLYTMVFIAALEIAFVIIVGWFANQMIIRTLLKLKTATEDFTKSGEYQQLNIQTNDELQDLAKHFELMQEKIIDNRKHLNEKIEKEVSKNRAKDKIILKQARASAMGDLMNTLAHQWRQPLNILSLLMEDLKEAYENHELDKEYFNNTYHQFGETSLSLSRIIDDFRSFFHPTGDKKDFSPYREILTVNEVLKYELSSKQIELFINITKDECKYLEILGYGSEFRQVLLNIVVNAIESIERKLEKGASFHPKITLTCEKMSNSIVLFVEDNGLGIPENIREKIFDPYFTTKEADIGKGIGLYMAKMSLQNMESDIEFIGDDKKTIFKIIINI